MFVPMRASLLRQFRILKRKSQAIGSKVFIVPQRTYQTVATMNAAQRDICASSYR